MQIIGCCNLHVAEVRRIRAKDLPEHRLDVVWAPLELDPLPPGGEGHAGILGLDRPPGIPKSIFKAIRVQLADLANQRFESFG